MWTSSFTRNLRIEIYFEPNLKVDKILIWNFKGKDLGKGVRDIEIKLRNKIIWKGIIQKGVNTKSDYSTKIKLEREGSITNFDFINLLSRESLENFDFLASASNSPSKSGLKSVQINNNSEIFTGKKENKNIFIENHPEILSEEILRNSIGSFPEEGSKNIENISSISARNNLFEKNSIKKISKNYNLKNLINKINKKKNDINIKQKNNSQNFVSSDNENEILCSSSNNNLRTSMNKNFNNSNNKLNICSLYSNESFEENVKGISCRRMKMILRSSYGDSEYIGLTGIQFFDENNVGVNIEKAKTIGALPKDVNTIMNNCGDPRIFENVFNLINETNDDNHMWLTVYNSSAPPYIEISYEEKITISYVKIWNYNKSIDLCRGVKMIDLIFDEDYKNSMCKNKIFFLKKNFL